ncbi:MAG: DUF4019 domain-containing protein [Candidatus Korobacteraceae bacterium]
MKSLLAVLLIVLGMSATALCQDKGEKAATEAANRWLALVDSGDYAASWETAAPMFKQSIAQDQWVKMVKDKRAPMGKLVSRTLKSAVYTTSLPGAPDGQYVVIVYESSFEHKKSAIETVTPSLGKDGQWKVSGYFIR